MTFRDTGLTPIGNGVGAGFRDGMVYLLTGVDFTTIERERRDGPRYAEAIRGARQMRHAAIRAALLRGTPLGQ